MFIKTYVDKNQESFTGEPQNTQNYYYYYYNTTIPQYGAGLSTIPETKKFNKFNRYTFL